MEHTTGFVKSEDGLNLYYQRWYPVTTPLAKVVFLHGIGGHSGQSTYTYLINHLVPLGYSIYGLDLRGHGKSEGRRGCINKWEDYRIDLQILLNQIKRIEPNNQPIFLLGQSLGGLLVIEYALHSHQEVQGVIASAPALSSPNLSPILIAFLKILAPILPNLILNPQFDVVGVSRDPKEVQKLLEDPLTEPKISPRLAVEFLSAIEWTQTHASELKLPLLLIHGAADPITPTKGSETFFKNVSYEDKTLYLYEGGYHQAFIDTNRDQVLKDIEAWLEHHLR